MNFFGKKSTTETNGDDDEELSLPIDPSQLLPALFGGSNKEDLKLKKNIYENNYNIACIYAIMYNKDSAFHYLNKAVKFNKNPKIFKLERKKYNLKLEVFRTLKLFLIISGEINIKPKKNL